MKEQAKPGYLSKRLAKSMEERGDDDCPPIKLRAINRSCPRGPRQIDGAPRRRRDPRAIRLAAMIHGLREIQRPLGRPQRCAQSLRVPIAHADADRSQLAGDLPPIAILAEPEG
jgi:hypothetical protein